MADQANPKRFIDSQKGWAGFTHVLARHVPFQLTQGGNARKALYALMRGSRR